MRNRALPLLAALAALTLSACHSDPDSTPPPSTPPTTPPTTPTSSTPPKPPPPNIPPAATAGLTVTSAEAFARFYLAASDYAEATGNTTLMRKWAYKSCKTCRAYAQTSEQTYRDGGSFAGQLGTRINRVAEARLVRHDTAVIVFEATVGRTQWRPNASATPTPFPGGSVIWDITLAADAGHWTMFEMELKE